MHHRTKRNIIWFTPTRAKEINGLALGTFPSSAWYNNDSLIIKGVHLEVNPIMLLAIPYVVFGSIASPFIWSDTVQERNRFSAYFDTTLGTSYSTVSGINIGVLGSGEMNHYKGISVSSVATIGRSFKGVSITAGQNLIYEYKGLLIAGLMNNVSKGRGLQIALINRCKDCKGVQIGLLNTMGKKTLPVINFQR